tara:strand:- start:225 stop:326 length:102 start_codon:yes stop_codon:yes gene_type:complete
VYDIVDKIDEKACQIEIEIEIEIGRDGDITRDG